MSIEQKRDTRKTMVTTRRHLLHVAASGFALATSGLFLPDGQEEADAREGALDGASGGRRGKDHKGRHGHKKQTHGDKKNKGKDQDTPRGVTRDPLPVTVAMSINNYRLVPVQVQGWQFLDKGESGQYYVPREWRWSTLKARAANGFPGMKEFPGYRTHAY